MSNVSVSKEGAKTKHDKALEAEHRLDLGTLEQLTSELNNALL